VIATALAYIRSSPRPISDRNLDDLACRIAEAVRIGELKEVGTPQYNEERDKALVDFLFLTGSDRVTYTATFHRAAAVWRLRGVRETMQAMLPPPMHPPPPRPAILLPAPPDLPFDPDMKPPLFLLLQQRVAKTAPPPK
jgi:hypothetical protein